MASFKDKHLVLFFFLTIDAAIFEKRNKVNLGYNVTNIEKVINNIVIK